MKEVDWVVRGPNGQFVKQHLLLAQRGVEFGSEARWNTDLCSRLRRNCFSSRILKENKKEINFDSQGGSSGRTQ